jgi:hypothetical protein
LMKRGLMMHFFRSDILFIANKPINFVPTPHGVYPTDHDMGQRQ